MTDDQDRPDQDQPGQDEPRQDDATAVPGREDPSATTMHLSAIGSTEVGEPADSSDGPAAIDPGIVAALRGGTALLRVDRGPNAGSRFLLDGDSTTVGRHPSSDIFLDDVTVSRRHAEFVREGTVFSVRDVGSLNGTYVNGQRIDSSPLATGDEVQVGKFRLVVMLGEAG
ncbi:FHA domain-containing protein [Angustibacter luteus]|uniref:FHA domain-containing protein n=1 Tax=Angustibacter luteus TaxID=658456 RepID=A0ABW1J9I9_9ACTN